MTNRSTFCITYWGVTGTLPAPLRPEEVTAKITQALLYLLENDHLAGLRPGPQTTEQIDSLVRERLPFPLRATYGGNTTCVEVQTPDALIILDAGSGLRELGRLLERRWNEPGFVGQRTAHLLLSHPHFDHWCGLPFADCLYDPRNRFTLHGSESVLHSLSALLCSDMPLSHSYFPPDYDLLKALRNFHVLPEYASFHIGNSHVRTIPLRHPGGCTGFRLDHEDRSFVFITDHEHPETPDRQLVEFARDADLLYLDG
jgi:phosphoribosyl 1,2-cyclic phosphodiesterase